MHILHTVPCRFPTLLTRRMCLTIKNFWSWWSFLWFLSPLCGIQWVKGEIRGWSLLKMKELKGNRTNLLISYLRLWNVSAVSSYLKVTLFSFTFWCNISLQNLLPYHSSSIQEKDTWSCLYFPVLGTPLSHSEWYLYTLPVAAESSLKTKGNDTCT